MNYTFDDLKKQVLYLAGSSDDCFPELEHRRRVIERDLYRTIAHYLNGSLKETHFHSFWKALLTSITLCLRKGQAFAIKNFCYFMPFSSPIVCSDFIEKYAIKLVKDESHFNGIKIKELSYSELNLKTGLSKAILKFFATEMTVCLGTVMKNAKIPVNIKFNDICILRADHQMMEFIMLMKRQIVIKEKLEHDKESASSTLTTTMPLFFKNLFHSERCKRPPRNSTALLHSYKREKEELEGLFRKLTEKDCEIKSMDDRNIDDERKKTKRKMSSVLKLKRFHQKQMKEQASLRQQQNLENKVPGLKVEEVDLPVTFGSFKGKFKRLPKTRLVAPFPVEPLKSKHSLKVLNSRKKMFYNDLNQQLNFKLRKEEESKMNNLHEEEKFVQCATNTKIRNELNLRERKREQQEDMRNEWKQQLKLNRLRKLLQRFEEGAITQSEIERKFKT